MSLRYRGLLFLMAVAAAPGLAGAESLADAAKREQERRQKNKEAGVTARVVGGDEIGTRPSDPNPSPRPTPRASGRRPGLRVSPEISEPPPSGASSAPSEVDSVRAATREALEGLYSQIAALADELDANVDRYQKGCAGGAGAAAGCESLFENIVEQAVRVSLAIDASEEEARKGWVPAGEIRELRRRHGLDDGIWDELVRIVNKYRKR